MKRIGIISDTHGTFDDTLREFLRDVDEIWHAGDIGSLEVSDRIAAFKPLRAVAGNIDDALTRRIYSDFNVFDCEGVRVLMTHIGGYPAATTRGRWPESAACTPNSSSRGTPIYSRSCTIRSTTCCTSTPAQRANTASTRSARPCALTIDGTQMRDMEVGEWSRR